MHACVPSSPAQEIRNENAQNYAQRHQEGEGLQALSGESNTNSTALPSNRTQIVSGSLPTCSVWKPWVLVVMPRGSVTGTGTAQMLKLLHVTRIPVIWRPVRVQEMLGAQLSRVWREVKVVARSAWDKVMRGQLERRVNSATMVSTQAWKMEMREVTPLMVMAATSGGGVVSLGGL